MTTTKSLTVLNVDMFFLLKSRDTIYFKLNLMGREKKMRKLEEKHDNLINSTRAMIDNNVNTRREIMMLRSRLARGVDEAKEIKLRILDKRDDLIRISDEIKTYLAKYNSYLEILIKEAEHDCESDWYKFEKGDIESLECFFENFLDHRKDYHLYKIRYERLSKDMRVLDNILEFEDRDDSFEEESFVYVDYEDY